MTQLNIIASEPTIACCDSMILFSATDRQGLSSEHHRHISRRFTWTACH